MTAADLAILLPNHDRFEYEALRTRIPEQALKNWCEERLGIPGTVSDGARIPTMAERLAEMVTRLPQLHRAEYERKRAMLQPDALLVWVEQRLAIDSDDPDWADAGEYDMDHLLKGALTDDAHPTGKPRKLPERMPSETELSLWTVAWGKHLDYVRDLLYPSLAQPGNLPALIRKHGYTKIHLDLYVGSDDVARARGIADELHLAFGRGDKIAVNIESAKPGETGTLAIKSLRESVRLSMERNTRLVIAPPDEFWGDGSLTNLCLYAKGHDFTVAATHLRVQPRFLPLIKQAMVMAKDGRISNARLVTLAMRTLAPGTASQFDDADSNSTFAGGMSIRRIQDDLWTVVNHIPSPRLAYFTEYDRAYFKQAASIGNWDHAWPTKLVPSINGRGPVSRLRVIGSSDVFMLAERTEPGMNQEAPRSGMLANDWFYDRRPHNELCQSFVTTLRGESE